MPQAYYDPYAVASAARVDVVTADNVTWSDAFQFDPPGMTGCPQEVSWPYGVSGPTWTFNGMNFQFQVKSYINGPTALLAIDSGITGCAAIVVDDQTNRILHFDVPETTIAGTTMATGCTGAGLVPGTYIYNFVMYDGSTPPIRTMLMQGRFILQAGV